MSCVSCLLVGSESLGPFSNILTSDHKYPYHNSEKFLQEVEQKLSSKVKQFFEILLHFWNLHEILSVLKTKIVFIAQIFSKLLSVKNVVTWMPEWFHLRTPFGGQGVKWPRILLKSTQQHFYASFPLISNKLSSVSCLLVGSEILGTFFDMLTPERKVFLS